MTRPDSNPDGGAADLTSLPPPPDPDVIEPREFEAAFGESLANVLSLDSWTPGNDLAAIYAHLERQIANAVRQETGYRQRIREVVLPRVMAMSGAPPCAGVWKPPRGVADIERIHRGLLLNGAVEACDGTSALHDTLPLTIAQLGVCLVSYHGDQGSWLHRLYRRDLRTTGLDPVEEALEVLERRQSRAAFEHDDPRDRLSQLARRGIMTYAERAILLKKSKAPWRMGHGNPTPLELLTGSGMKEMVERSLDLLDELVKYRRFVFVSSAPRHRLLLTLGNALDPLEYLIFDTHCEFLGRVAARFQTPAWGSLGRRMAEFAGDVGPQVVVGAYRASPWAPPQVFYAHRDHAHDAALIALADSVLQEHRGFPLLIDLADQVCSATFGGEMFAACTQLAYLEAGEPFRYLTERQTRR